MLLPNAIACDSMLGKPVPPRGSELSQESSGNSHDGTQSGTVCGTLIAHSGLIDADLRSIIEAWASLAESTKAEILAMVESTAG